MTFAARAAGVLALFIAGVALKLHTDRVVRVVEARGPIGEVLPLPSGEVHLLDEGKGRAVVLVHGSDGVMNDWPTSGLFARVAARARTLAYDRPGHGFTPVPPGERVNLDLNVRMLRDLLRARGVRRPVLLGHSYGASVALAYAWAYPNAVAGLLLLAPTAYPRASLTRPLAHLILVPGLRELITRVLILPVGRVLVELEGGRAFFPFAMPPAWRDMMLALSRRPRQALALAQENRTVGAEVGALARAYRALKVPCTIVSGRFDQLTPHAAHAVPLACALPHARLVTVEGGHEVHWSHGEVVLRELLRLLQETADA